MVYGLWQFMPVLRNDHDLIHAIELLKQIGISGSSVLANRAYEAIYAIPLQSNVPQPWLVDWRLYKRTPFD